MYVMVASTPKLIFVNPEWEGQSFDLPEGKTIVGRSPETTLMIDDDSVSGRHCEILTYGCEVIIRDNGSSNGTWVDGRKVRGQTAVHNGQTIRFACVEARLEMPPLPRKERFQTEHTAIYDHARFSRKGTAAPPSTSPTIIKPRAKANAAPASVPSSAADAAA